MIGFEPTDSGLLVRDDIEDVVFRIDVDGRDLRPAPPESFYFPVDDGARTEASTLAFPRLFAMYVRQEGDLRASCSPGEELSIEAGAYEIEVTSGPMKLYLRLEGPFEVTAEESRTVLRLDGRREVTIGARSFHERPAGTVTVPEDPESLMRAVSTFGSALKTISPERAFPTLRGHPPLVEFGDAVSIPEFVRETTPETGIRIEVPATWGDVYVVSTLAYYLGAEVVPGQIPRVVAADREYGLTTGSVASEVATLLEHAFLLDCVVRTEGFYQIDLHQRREVEARVEIDPARLYDLPADERLAAYFEIPRDPLADVLDWHLTTDVTPVPKNAEILPFVANDLSHVRDPSRTTVTETTAEPGSLDTFYRDAPAAEEFTRSDVGTRATDRTTQNGDTGGTESVITPEPVDTVGHAWVGEGYPMGASKPTVSSYERRLEQEPVTTDPISVQVVCNEPEMREETENLYGFRDFLEFDIDIAMELSTDEVRALLARDHDFFHFIGHVDAEGMKCTDGYLDLHTLEESRVKAFLLNACSSYEQGMELVRAGSIGGLVTTTDVGNIMATSVGRTLARLLDQGFDLYAALDVAKEIHVVGGTYSIVGNASVTLCQSATGNPIVHTIERNDSGSLDITYMIYTTQTRGIGSFAIDHISDDEIHFLTGTPYTLYDVSRERAAKPFNESRVPLIVDYELRWSDEVDFSEL